MTTKRGRGRPPLPADEQRSHRLELRVSADELAAADRLAAHLGVERAEAVRRAVAEADARAQRPTRARRGGGV